MRPESSPVQSSTRPLSLAAIPECRQALTDELTLLAGQINAAQHRFLILLAALIEREAWGGDSGIKSPAHWLNYYCGIDFGAAREKVRVAKALQSLPLIDAAFASGAISYSKVRAMTRSATPQNEEVLLNVARHGTAQHVETLVRQHRRVQQLNCNDQASASGNDAGASQHQARELSYYYDEDGMLVIRGRFAAEEGALVVKALECALESIEQEQISEGPGERQDAAETFQRKRADALLALAEGFLAAARHKHDADAGRLNNADKYQVLIHLDARADSPLSRIGLHQSGHLEDGPALPPSTLKRLTCDASQVAVTRDKTGNVLNIGRKSRCVPPGMRRALKIRDGGCRYPGCGQTRYVDAHHIRHWCDGGETRLDNLILLCRHHHRALHSGAFDVDENLRFTDRHGQEIRLALYPQFPAPNVSGTLGGDANIGANTAVTRWQGETMDYNLAVAALVERDSAPSGKRVSIRTG